MQENQDFHIADIISKFIKGVATLSEKQALKEWLEKSNENRALFNELTHAEELSNRLQMWDTSNTEQLWSKIQHIAYPKVSRYKLYFRRLSVAAAILLPVCALSFYLLNFPHGQAINTKSDLNVVFTPSQQQVEKSKEVQLILNDGRVVNLDKPDAKHLNELDGTIIRNESHVLQYNSALAKGDLIAYNSIIIPHGTSYKIVLADGTKVWLNNASSLRFPTHFKGKSREVFLSGEAYFEVAKNIDKPFKVNTQHTQVLVMGTHFNVMAYKNEPMVKTTLFEGSVNVMNGTVSKILKPGEQAQSALNEIRITTKDTEQAIAWKNDLFSFNNTDIETLKRQIERWYDVRLSYKEQMPETKLTGEISRKISLTEVLDMLAFKGIHLKTF